MHIINEFSISVCIASEHYCDFFVNVVTGCDPAGRRTSIPQIDTQQATAFCWNNKML